MSNRSLHGPWSYREGLLVLLTFALVYIAFSAGHMLVVTYTIGMREYRAWLKLKAKKEEEEAEAILETETEEPEEAETEVSPEEVAGKFRALCARAAEELRRGKRLGRLLDSEVSWEARPEQWSRLRISRGQIQLAESDLASPPSFPWEGLRIEEFERMSVLLSELHKFPHRVQPKTRN